MEDGKERGVWSTLVVEEGIFWYVGEETGWCTLGRIQVGAFETYVDK